MGGGGTSGGRAFSLGDGCSGRASEAWSSNGHAALAMVRAAAGAAEGHGYLRRAQTLVAEATGTPARCGAAFVAAGLDSPLADGDFGLDDQIELASAILPRAPPPPPIGSGRT